MKKKFITVWRISIFTIATVLFVQLFTIFGAADSSIRVGRVVVPSSYLSHQNSSEQSTQLTERFWTSQNDETK